MIKNYRKNSLFPSKTIAYLVLVSRLILFLLFQAIIALVIKSWESSEKYWLFSATLTNIVSVFVLIILFKKEGKNYLQLFIIDRSLLKKDIMIFLGITLITVPVVLISGYFTSKAIWGNPDTPTNMMFFRIEKWMVYFQLVAFPVSIAFAELATYFMYVMPKLKETLKMKWLAVFLPILFLSIQHCTLPFIPDVKFIIYRAIVFLPFAAIIGISINKRPSLFIYFAILHGIMDFGTAYMFVLKLN